MTNIPTTPQLYSLSNRRPPLSSFPWRGGQTLGSAVWFELFDGFRRMRNRQAMQAIMAGVQLAEDTSGLRQLYPGIFMEFPLSGDNDKSFWGTSVEDDADDEPAAETNT